MGNTDKADILYVKKTVWKTFQIVHMYVVYIDISILTSWHFERVLLCVFVYKKEWICNRLGVYEKPNP